MQRSQEAGKYDMGNARQTTNYARLKCTYIARVLSPHTRASVCTEVDVRGDKKHVYTFIYITTDKLCSFIQYVFPSPIF